MFCAFQLLMTPLHWAVESRNAEIVKILLEHGSSPTAKDKFSKTADELAIDKGDYYIAKMIQVYLYNNIFILFVGRYVIRSNALHHQVYLLIDVKIYKSKNKLGA